MMCMFDENGVMLPELFDKDGNKTGPKCDGCGKCGYSNDDDDLGEYTVE